MLQFHCSFKGYSARLKAFIDWQKAFKKIMGSMGIDERYFVSYAELCFLDET
jgi:hypothetical protein